MNEEQIRVVRALLEYTRSLEYQLWADDVEDAIVILTKSMVTQAESDLLANGGQDRAASHR